MRYFLDTNVLLDDFEKYTTLPFVISSETLKELESIKTNRNKTEDVRVAARHATRWLSENDDKYEVVVYNECVKQIAVDNNLDYASPDIKICCSAAYWQNNNVDVDHLVFVTYDLSCRNIAGKILMLDVEYEVLKLQDEYKGFLEVTLDDDELAYFYEHQNENIYELLINQYLIIKNHNGDAIDNYRWDGEKHQPIKIGNIKSELFGLVKPYKGDVYQQCVLNSFINNKITMVRGKAGTGKTYCAIGYLLFLLEKHKIDKIILFTNTQPTINTARLGFYPGSRDEKLRESSIGNILASKLGDSFMLDKLMSEGKLMLLPMCDIRGYDTTGMAAGVFITESQNLSVDLMKLALQRIGEDSICIIDGDYNAQVDSDQYAGKNNGMRRLSEVFRGQDFYGEVELQNIYRSRIAELAEQM